MPNSRGVATLIGLTAVLMWSFLAFLTTASGGVPPLQLAAMTFAIGGAAGLIWLGIRGSLGDLRQGWPAWLHGVGGLFGYHFCYFFALKSAPPAQAGLIAYLWPLLIVILSSFLPGERLKTRHLAGALAGFAGTALILAGGAGMDASGSYGAGYAAAFACALIWSGYSVLARKLHAVPTGAVAGFCLATAALAALVHPFFETTVMPDGIGQWAAILALGLFPVGAAFYAWDVGMKRGDIRLLGVASYAAPLLSTALLVAAGKAEPGWILALSALLIVAGAALASSRRSA
jgi:drug/metabolite transporter (DMT)-like permease